MYRNKSNPAKFGSYLMEISKMTQGSDIFNSELLYKITRFPDYRLNTKIIESKSNTPNSVAYELYGDQIYSWILILFNPYLSHIEYSIGDKVLYPNLVELNNFLNS